MADLNGRATALSPTEMLRLDQWAESLTWTWKSLSRRRIRSHQGRSTRKGAR